jgi:hypothetical protein
MEAGSWNICIPEGRRLKLEHTANEVWRRRAHVPMRLVCQLVGQISSLQLARAADETTLFAYQLNSFEDQLMHKHKRKADYVIQCDASDHALAAIIIKAPGEKDVQRPFYRRLHPQEVGWSSVLRELTGYHGAYLTLRRRRNMSGKTIKIVGDSLCCQYIFEKGGSQVADDETGVLMITEKLLNLLSAADADGAEVRFCWVRREYVQDADDLSKFMDRTDFGLRPDWREYVSTKFGPWDVDRFAGDHSTTAKRFNSLFDSRHAEAVDTMAQDWSKGLSFILPGFHSHDQPNHGQNRARQR